VDLVLYMEIDNSLPNIQPNVLNIPKFDMMWLHHPGRSDAFIIYVGVSRYVRQNKTTYLRGAHADRDDRIGSGPRSGSHPFASYKEVQGRPTL
jgi:hypothetical protein